MNSMVLSTFLLFLACGWFCPSWALPNRSGNTRGLSERERGVLGYRNGSIIRKSLPYRTVQRERERRRPAECKLLTPIMVTDYTEVSEDQWKPTQMIQFLFLSLAETTLLKKKKSKKVDPSVKWGAGWSPVDAASANRQLGANSAITDSSRRSAEAAEGGNTSSSCCQVSQQHRQTVLSAGIKPQRSHPWMSWSTLARPTWCWIIDKTTMYYTSCEEETRLPDEGEKQSQLLPRLSFKDWRENCTMDIKCLSLQQTRQWQQVTGMNP